MFRGLSSNEASVCVAYKGADGILAPGCDWTDIRVIGLRSTGNFMLCRGILRKAEMIQSEVVCSRE